MPLRLEIDLNTDFVIWGQLEEKDCCLIQESLKMQRFEHWEFQYTQSRNQHRLWRQSGIIWRGTFGKEVDSPPTAKNYRIWDKNIWLYKQLLSVLRVLSDEISQLQIVLKLKAIFLFQNFMHFTNCKQISGALEHCQIKDITLMSNLPSAGHYTIS